MTLYAKIENNKVRKLVDTASAPTNGTWVDASGTPNVWVGWSWNGSAFSAPGTSYRTTITAFEWLQEWTADEWADIVTLTQQTTATGKNMAVIVEALKTAEAIDLTNNWTIAFYTILETETIIDATRKAELLQGIAD